LGACGAGACIALGAGHGVAAADTDVSDSSDSTSQSSAESSPSSSPWTRARSTDDGGHARISSAAQSIPPTTKRRSAAEIRADDKTESSIGADTESSAPVKSRSRPAAREATDVEPGDSDAQPVAADATAPARGDGSTDDGPVGNSVPSAEATASTVTGVQTGRAKLTIPVGPKGYATRADWYLPTQADGSVTASGVVWLQHGFLGNKAAVSKLARTLSQQTNSIVVAPNLSSFPLACAGCWINGVPMQQAVAAMFIGDRASLTASAKTAGFTGVLPEDFVMSGQSAGGGFATAVGGYYAANPVGTGNLRGVVMFDGFSFNGVLTDSLRKLNDPFIPVYQVAAPPQSWNSNGASTRELVAARPGQFVGATLARGSHADALIGGDAIFDFLAQLVAGVSPPGNTQAAYTLATGWINDMYRGLGPADGTGIYGVPDQYIVMGDTAAIVLAAPPVVNLAEYLGTWFEVGSVKQFFSIGLVNTKAAYSRNADGSIKVENSGNYFVNDGPTSTIVGSALPVDPITNNRLNVRFFGPASSRPPGNYWIVDLASDYRWAVVTDSSGRSGFLLSRTPTVSADFYRELLDRASVNGVKGRITPTRQLAGPGLTSDISGYSPRTLVH
jgi:lipocalin